MSQHIDFFKSESKKLVKQYETQAAEILERVRKHVKDVDGFCLARAQHVVARESGFNRWEELLHASADRLQFGVVLYKNPLLTMVEGWSSEGDEINPYKESDRRALIDNYGWVMRIVSWLRGNGVCPPANPDDTYFFHTGVGKDCFSRLFVQLFKEPYKYTGTGLVIAAFLMCGFKPLSLSDPKYVPLPGEGRCNFAISYDWWKAVCEQYPSLKN